MKELFLNDKKVYIKSSEDILNWDSEYQKELYQYCYNFILKLENISHILMLIDSFKGKKILII